MGCPSQVEIGDSLVFSICTHDPDTGVLTDADAVPSYRVYEDETDPPILTGNMAKLDDDDTTGFYTESIACTAGNGFEAGKSYTIYISATVDSDTGGICFGFKAVDTESRLSTIAGYIDTEIAAITAKMPTNYIMGSDDQDDHNTELEDWANGGRLDLLLDAIKAKTDNLPSSVPKNVAFDDFGFALLSSQDHVTPITGLSVDGYISKDGGSFASLTNSISSIGSGAYKVDITSTEMNADSIILKFSATGADTRLVFIKTDS